MSIKGLVLNQLVENGGKGSGNHNPGQGRGVGKPNGGGSKLIGGYYVKSLGEAKQIKENLKESIKTSQKDVEQYQKEYEKKKKQEEEAGDYGWDNSGFTLMNIDKTKERIEKMKSDLDKLDKSIKEQEKAVISDTWKSIDKAEIRPNTAGDNEFKKFSSEQDKSIASKIKKQVEDSLDYAKIALKTYEEGRLDSAGVKASIDEISSSISVLKSTTLDTQRKALEEVKEKLEKLL